MTSEEKKPKRKYGQNWAKLSNSQADVSAVYQKLVGQLSPLLGTETTEKDQQKIKDDLLISDEIKPDLEVDQRLEKLIANNTTEDILSPRSMSLETKLPQGYVVPGDNISSGISILPHNQIKETLESSNNTNNINLISNSIPDFNTKDKMSLEPISPWSEIESNYLKIPNFIIDNIMKTLDSSEFTVYLRLYRLSHGFKQTSCLVGYAALSEACNLSSRQIRRIIPNLVSRNLIRIVQVYNEAQKQGTLYEVYTLDKMSLASKKHQGQNVSSAKMSTNKYDDHDDLKRQDHHQTEHEKNVMMIYQNVTGNVWTKADLATYQKIKNIPLEAIEIAIKLATQRASSRPNSLAFFVKEIIATANPKTNRSKQKKSMEKIIDRLRNSLVGSTYSMSDFVYKVKELCLRENIAFDNDLLDEILTK